MKNINEIINITDEIITEMIEKTGADMNVEYVRENIDSAYMSRLIMRIHHLLDKIGLENYKKMLIEEEIKHLIIQ